MSEGWENRPYAQWLENAVKLLVEVDPDSIAMEMTDADGKIYTCYWNTSQNDRAQFIGAMQDDDRMEWVMNNREAILDILRENDGDGEENDEDGEGGVWTTTDL